MPTNLKLFEVQGCEVPHLNAMISVYVKLRLVNEDFIFEIWIAFALLTFLKSTFLSQASKDA